mgnify:CR=1 FL=1
MSQEYFHESSNKKQVFYSLSNLIPNSSCTLDQFPSLDQKIAQTLNLQSYFVKQLACQSYELNQKLLSIKQEVEKLSIPNLPKLSLSIPSKEVLLHYVSGSTNHFDFDLQLLGDIPNPACKGKYFSFQVQLTPNYDLVFPCQEKLTVNLEVYSAETPPKLLRHNMSGSEIIKGVSSTLLVFDKKKLKHTGKLKIQLNEVSSHFPNGWVFLVVKPSKGQKYLRRTEVSVKPLVVNHLVVKAKEVTCKKWREKGKVRNITSNSENS